ncbi:MAG: Spy/CpxP family protein refolding chaperone, partial [Chromatiales bacterium]|nr:Spy/CpxP family protein refolding chaperone [Chromatiales bacterium]
TCVGMAAGLVVASTAVADGAPNMMAPGTGHNMGQGMMAPHMQPGMGQGMMGRNMGSGSQPMMPGMRNRPGSGPFSGVQFNEKQQKKIAEMMESERKDNQQRVKTMRAAQKRLQKVYQSEKWDVNEINKIYDEIFAEQKKTIAAMAKARNEVVELMTKEQKEQMKKMQATQQARMQQMREMRQKRMEQMRSQHQQAPQQ